MVSLYQLEIYESVDATQKKQINIYCVNVHFLERQKYFRLVRISKCYVFEIEWSPPSFKRIVFER